MAAFDWDSVLSDISQGTSKRKPVFLSDSSIPPGGAQIEGQIGEGEDPYIGDFFRDMVKPIIEKSKVDMRSLDVLELGSGFGKLAYGMFQSCQPNRYIATDVIPDLFESLASNLTKWAPVKTQTAVAVLDPQDPLKFKQGAFNVIQSHSVLHHVLDYKTAIRSLYDKLASPGVLIFAEPFVDGYLLFCMFSRLVQQKINLSKNVQSQLSALEENVVARTIHRDDLTYLSRFGTGDKHIYSIHDLLSLANHLNAQLIVQRDSRSLHSMIMCEFQVRGASEQELKQIGSIITELLPPGIENALFSDLRHVFGFAKPSGVSQ